MLQDLSIYVGFVSCEVLTYKYVPPMLTIFGNMATADEVKMRSLGWPSSNMTGILQERG